MRFRDRADAGRKLAEALAKYKQQNPLVLALPRGGVAVGAEVAAALDAPLDILLVRKISAPIQPELAIGAVVDGAEPVVVRNPTAIESTATSEQEFQMLCTGALAEIERRRIAFCGDRVATDVAGRVVIIVDDGIATGATARAALRSLRARHPKRIVLAVPVAPTSAIEELRTEVDDVICLEDLGGWGAIGYFYDDFRQLTDEDVIDLLAQAARPTAPNAIRRNGTIP